MRALVRELSSIPLILRCAVVGAGCTGAIAGVLVVINVIDKYPVDHVVQAMLFGLVEALVFGGIIGSMVGLVVGVLAYLARGVIRSVLPRRG